MIDPMATPDGMRYFDFRYPDPSTGELVYVELKNSGDPVTPEELVKDTYLHGQGMRLEYGFTTTQWGKSSLSDLSQVENRRFPFRLYNFRQPNPWRG